MLMFLSFLFYFRSLTVKSHDDFVVASVRDFHTESQKMAVNCNVRVSIHTHLYEHFIHTFMYMHR